MFAEIIGFLMRTENTFLSRLYSISGLKKSPAFVVRHGLSGYARQPSRRHGNPLPPFRSGSFPPERLTRQPSLSIIFHEETSGRRFRRHTAVSSVLKRPAADVLLPAAFTAGKERFCMIQQLITPNLVLRKARDGDLDSIWQNVWSDGRIAGTMLWKVTETREDAVQRLERTKNYQASNDAFFVCLKETDEPIGFAGLRETAPGEFEETGICIAVRFQKRGFGREVLGALVDLAFRRLGGHRFIYGCFHENTASAAVCKSCGFVYTHSEKAVRDWDGYEYLCDFYELTDYGKEPGS